MEKKYTHHKITKHHQDELGMQIPKGYFEQSKMDILKAIQEENKHEKKVIRLSPFRKYSIAASIALLIGLAFLWRQNSTPATTMELQVEETTLDYLLADDQEMDAFIDTLFMDEMAIITEKHIPLNDTSLDMLLMEDSLVDPYLDQEFIEEMI